MKKQDKSKKKPMPTMFAKQPSLLPMAKAAKKDVMAKKKKK